MSIFFRFYTTVFKATGLALPFLAIGIAASDADPLQTTAPSAVASQLAPGDLAVAGFSGTKLAVDGIAPGLDPVEKTVIDTEGSVLRVFDLTALPASLSGQLGNPAVKIDVKAKDLGQVFAVAVDDAAGTGTPAIFAGATSAFGLAIVAATPDKDGSPMRLKAGAPGAHFMAGQFGGLAGAGPGTIFKIDGSTGTPTVFASTDTGGVANSGAGLSALAIDGTSRSLYAADLDTGLIHRFGLDNGGASTSQFDHGVAGRSSAGLAAIADDGKRLDPASSTFKPDDLATWGLTQSERRVTGLAVHDRRLFYAIADGPQIWSLALSADGSLGNDARLELALAGEKPGAVTAMTFDNEGNLIAAVRGLQKAPFDFGKFVEPDSGRVLRFAPAASGTSGSRWSSEPQQYAVGAADGNASAAGGLTLGHGYDANGALDVAQCNATLLVSGDTLLDPASDERVVHGVQLNAANLVAPAYTPPSQSALVDYDGRLGNTGERGHVGAVAAIQRCGAGGALPPVEGEPLVARGPPVEGSPPAAGGGASPPVEGAGAPGDQATEQAAPAAEGCSSAPPASTVGQNVRIAKGPTCTFDQFGKTNDCVWDVEVSNQGQVATNIQFSFQSSTPASFIGPVGHGASATPQDTSTAIITAPGLEPGATTTVSVLAEVPPDAATPVGTVQIAAPVNSSQSCADNTAGNTPPDPDAPNLAIQKTQNCTVSGGKAECSYSIKVKNTGATPFDFSGGTVEDSFSIPPDTFDVTGGGGEKTASGFRMTVPAGTTIPAGNAPPNIPTVKATFTVPQGGLVVENCASMSFAPAGAAGADVNPGDDTSCTKFDTSKPDDQGTPTNEPTQTPPDDQQAAAPPQAPPPQTGPVRIEKTAAGACPASDGFCTFQIEIKNTGTALVPGPIPFDDAIQSDGDLAIKAIATSTIFPTDGSPTPIHNDLPPNAPDPCGPIGDTSIPCKIPVALPPGAHILFTTAFQFEPGAQPATTIHNCATLTGSGNQACADVPFVPPPKQVAKLEIKKELNGDPACTKVAAGTGWLCHFRVVITNRGTEKFTDRVVLSDENSLESTVAGSNTLVCDDKQSPLGRSHRCEAQLALDPGQPFVFPIDSFLPFKSIPQDATVANGGCQLTNTATLAFPPGQENPTTAPVTAVLPAVENGGIKVPCDPPSLALAKTAQGCKASGGGFECRYRLTVTSVGPDPFQNGDIDIDELLPAGATVQAHSAEWTCPGSGSATRCSLKGVSLPVNAARDLDLTVSVPASAVSPGQCEMPNTAQIVQPGRDMTLAGAKLRASASAKIDSPACNKTKCDSVTKAYNAAQGTCVDAPSACKAPFVGEYPTCCHQPEQTYDAATKSCRSSTVSCYGGMVLIAATEQCGCPPGRTYDTQRRTCTNPPPALCLAGYSGVYPVCCSPAQYYSEGECRKRAPVANGPRGESFTSNESEGARNTRGTASTGSPKVTGGPNGSFVPTRCASGLPKVNGFCLTAGNRGGAFSSNNNPVKANKATGGAFTSNNNPSSGRGNTKAADPSLFKGKTMTPAYGAYRPPKRVPSFKANTKTPASGAYRPLKRVPSFKGSNSKANGGASVVQPATKHLHAIGRRPAGGSRNESINYGACATCNKKVAPRNPN